MRTKAPDYAEKEKASHGDIFLPVSSYHCLVPESYRELALHWHEEMEITLICEGMSDYKVGQVPFRAQQGDIVLVPPYCTHAAFEIPGKTMTSDSIVFHLDFLGAHGRDLSASKYLRPLSEGRMRMPAAIRPDDPGYGEILAAFIAAKDCFLEKPPFYEIRLREHLLHLLILLFEYGYITESEESRNAIENRQQLIGVLQYIADHYREKLNVAELAALSGFSESYFMNSFRQQVGMSCIRYINHYRIQRAAEALEETSAPVMEIAMDNGFDNISYFNLQFRREFGMTPRDFRRRMQDKTLPK